MDSFWNSFSEGVNYLTGLVSSGVNYIPAFQADELDCTVRENALNVLGLTDAEAQNQSLLDQRYADLSKQWQERIQKAQDSEPLVIQFTKLNKRVQISYQTLNKHTL